MWKQTKRGVDGQETAQTEGTQSGRESCRHWTAHIGDWGGSSWSKQSEGSYLYKLIAQVDCMLLASQWKFLINSDFRSYQQWYVYWLCCIHQAASLHFLSMYRCLMCHYTICMHRSHFSVVWWLHNYYAHQLCCVCVLSGFTVHGYTIRIGLVGWKWSHILACI